MGLPLTALNRLITPTGTPDMVLAGGGITNVATSMTLNASPGVPANVPAAGTVRALIYNTGDTNPEFIDIDLSSRSTLTFTIARETEESGARPKCAHSAGAGIWFVGTAAMFSYAVGGLSVQELVLGADYTVPNGSFGDVTGMSITLPAGDYLVEGQVFHQNPSNTGSMTVAITDGSTVYAHATSSISVAGFGKTIPINKKIHLSTTTTIKLQARANTATCEILKGEQLVLGAPYVLGTVLTFTSGGGGGGGALVLLEQHTASGSASLDFTAAISPTYDEYEIHVNNIVPTVDNVALCLQVSTDGGVTWDTGAHYQWSHLYEVAGGTGSGGNDTGGAANIVLAPNITTVANFSLNGRMTLFNPLGSNYKAVVGHFHTRFSSGDARRYGTILDGQYEQTTPVNALRFIIGGGSNIASGTIRIYGVAKTGGPAAGISSGLYAARPSAGSAIEYFATDSPILSVSVAGAWQEYFAGWPLVNDGYPSSWVNQGGASLDTTLGGLYLAAPATSGDNWRILDKAAPATPYTLTVGLLITLPNSGGGGIMFRNAGSGKIVVAGLFDNSGLSIRKFDSPTTFNAFYQIGGANSSTLIGYMQGTPLWLRIADDGTNRVTSWSTDRRTWNPLHSVGRTDFITADRIGIALQPSNAGAGAGMWLLSWDEA